ncbi:hypothetical protein AB0F81_02650 [Actinoplanes sp. NPDC024001]|uniref:hypothetical protein n=1 Tax=Actinoplanes sp. NPDC024001 TaxID=3154598 RepID=UPI0033F2B4BE
MTPGNQVHTEPTGDLAVLGERLMARQPGSHAYLDWTMTMLTDFYYMRLLITVTPDEVVPRPAVPWAEYRAIRASVRG